MLPASSDWIIGETVPWAVSWSGEQKYRLTPSPYRPGALQVDQLERPGDGRPVFTINHAVRNRRGLVELLCQVCGRPTEPGDRWIFPRQTGSMITLHDGGRGFGLNIPPLHGDCARKAATLCPHLTRQEAEPWPAAGDPGRLVWRTDVFPGMEPLARQAPPGVEVIYGAYRLFDADASARISAWLDA